MIKSELLRGKTAIVTGGSTGIGKEIARSLASNGAKVCLVGRNVRALETLRAELSEFVPAQSYVADLRNFREIDSLVDRIESSCGASDILMNIAGLWHDNDRAYYGPKFDEIGNEEVLDVLNVGVSGTLLLTKRVLRGMKRKRRGKVIFISCGFAGAAEAAGWVHYFVANKAVEALTQGLAAECRSDGIQVNCIAPWFVATEAVLKFFPDKVQKALRPADVAAFATFLASPQADHMSGQVTVLRSESDTQLL